MMGLSAVRDQIRCKIKSPIFFSNKYSGIIELDILNYQLSRCLF